MATTSAADGGPEQAFGIQPLEEDAGKEDNQAKGQDVEEPANEVNIEAGDETDESKDTRIEGRGEGRGRPLRSISPAAFQEIGRAGKI